MCVRRKNLTGSRKEKLNMNSKNSLIKSAYEPTAKSPSPPVSMKTLEQVEEKSKEKELKSSTENAPKTADYAAGKDEKSKKEPLHIQIPPPRIIKARRPMDEIRSPHDPEYKTLEPDNSEWESVKIMKRSELNADGVEKKKVEESVLQQNRVELIARVKSYFENNPAGEKAVICSLYIQKTAARIMCIRRKKSSVSSRPENARSKSAKSPLATSPKSQKTQSVQRPMTAEGRTPTEPPKEKAKENKSSRKEQEAGASTQRKPMENDPAKDQRAKTPLHIQVPPPRIMRARRPMREVRSARDPEYKTLEVDMSEWESVKIMKRSDVNLEDMKKDPVIQPTP